MIFFLKNCKVKHVGSTFGPTFGRCKIRKTAMRICIYICRTQIRILSHRFHKFVCTKALLSSTEKELHIPFSGYLFSFTIHSPLMQYRNNRRRHCFKSKTLLSQEACASPSTLIKITAAWKKYTGMRPNTFPSTPR